MDKRHNLNDAKAHAFTEFWKYLMESGEEEKIKYAEIMETFLRAAIEEEEKKK